MGERLPMQIRAKDGLALGDNNLRPISERAVFSSFSMRSLLEVADAREKHHKCT
jgi:hypothetical protein